MSANEQHDQGASVPRKGGRPSLVEEAEIEKEIWDCFSNYMLPQTAKKSIHRNIKTIKKYYNKFAARRINLNEQEFVEQCKVNIESACATLDRQLGKLYSLQEKLEAKIPTFTNEFAIISACGELRRIVKTISELVDLKLKIDNAPTADIHLMKMAEEVLKKYGSMAN